MNDKYKAFRRFLYEDYSGTLGHKPLSQQAVMDAASRCRRVEKVLMVQLEDFLNGDGGLKNIEALIQREAGSFNIKGDVPNTISSILHAVRLYNKYWQVMSESRLK